MSTSVLNAEVGHALDKSPEGSTTAPAPTPIGADFDPYYEVLGAEGTWLIFAGGGAATHLSWWRQINRFRTQHRCLSYDARGVGQTGGEADLTRDPDDLLALMDHLNIEKAFINGWSLGGFAATRLAQRHPDRVLGLLLADTAFGGSNVAVIKWADSLTQSAAQPRMEETVKPSEALYLSKMVQGLAAPRWVHGASTGDMVRSAVDGTSRETIKVPTLFLTRSGPSTAQLAIRQAHEAVPNSKFLAIPHLGAALPFDGPEIYNAILEQFTMQFQANIPDAQSTFPAGSLIGYFEQMSAKA